MGIAQDRMKAFSVKERLLKLHDEVSPVSIARVAIERLQKSAARLDESMAPSKHDAYVRVFVRLIGECQGELSRYTAPAIVAFLGECKALLDDNSTYIAIEETIASLEYSRGGVGAFERAIEDLRKASASETPDFFVTGNLGGSRWIPQVNSLFEAAQSRTGSSSRDNRAGFTVTTPRSVVITEGGTRSFFSDGLVIETGADGLKLKSLTEAVATAGARQDFMEQQCSHTGDVVTFYPSPRCAMTGSLTEGTMTVSIDGTKQDVDAAGVENFLKLSGAVRLSEMGRVSEFLSLVAERESIADIDFATHIRDARKEVSATLFVLEGKVYVQMRNKAMGRNSFEEMPAADAVEALRRFIGYDVTEQVKHLFVGEADAEAKAKEALQLAEGRVQQIEDRIARVAEIAAERGVTDPARIEAAKAMLESELAGAREQLSACLTSLNEAKGKKDDAAGFTPGEAVEDFESASGDVKKGTKLRVRAIDYTAGGGDDEVEYIVDGTGQTGKTSKKNLVAH